MSIANDAPHSVDAFRRELAAVTDHATMQVYANIMAAYGHTPGTPLPPCPPEILCKLASALAEQHRTSVVMSPYMRPLNSYVSGR